MRRALAVLALGAGALAFQSALATQVPGAACPDLGLLVVVALGLHWRGEVSGLVLAAALGYGADLLSGSLFGEHALLRLLAYAAARLASSKLNLRGALPLACFVWILTGVYGLGVAGLAALLGGDPGGGWGRLGPLVLHASLNAALAPAVSRLVGGLLAWAGEAEARRRPLAVEPRGRWA